MKRVNRTRGAFVAIGLFCGWTYDNIFVWKFPFAAAVVGDEDLAAIDDKQQCETPDAPQQRVASNEAVLSTSPTVLVGGIPLTDWDSRLQIRPSSKDLSNITSRQHYHYVLNEAKNLWYVPGFINQSLATEMMSSFCQGRFVRSPIRGAVDDGTIEHQIRTSESCTLIPAAVYLAHDMFLAKRHQPEMARIVREVDVAWEIAERVSDLFDGAIDPKAVEPLQIVRYTTPNAFYKVHHDHGGYYGKTTENRSFTILVYLNDVFEGGHTYFPKLDMRISPRSGDAIVWSNVHLESGEIDADMVHAGEPPSQVGISKYAINIWVLQQQEPGYIGWSRREGTWSDKSKEK